MVLKPDRNYYLKRTFMLLYNLKLVFRNLLKNKLYSFLSITGFAIGFAVCIVIALFVYNEYTVDHCYPNYSSIYRLIDERSKTSRIDYNLNKLLSDNNPEVELTCPFDEYPSEFTVKSDSRSSNTTGLFITSNSFFKLFSIHVLKAISNEPFSDKQTAIITESLAKKLFKKNEEPLGKPITVFNLLNATITAIVEDLPVNSSIKGNVFLNVENKDYRLSTSCETNDKCWNPLNHYLKLDERANPKEFVAKLNHNINTYKFAIDSIGIQKLSDIYLDTTLKDNCNLQGNRNLIIVFMAIGMLIMLLSIINYLNYNLSLQYSRLKEVGIKRINGAGFSHLIGYHLTDVSVSILISIDIALIIVGIFLPYINGLLDKQLSLAVLLTPVMLIFSTNVVILIILINIIAPLYILSRYNSNSIFLGKTKVQGKLVGRNFLTAFQFITAIALLSSALFIQKQLVYAQNTDLGFDKKHLLRLSLPYNFKQQLVLKQEINKLSFVVSSTLSHGSLGENIYWLGSDTIGNAFNLGSITVDDDFIKTMNIELMDGRGFLKGDIGTACIMNQEAIKQFGWKDINSKRFNNGRVGGYQVVGLVKNFHIGSLHQAILPVCLLSCTADWAPNFYNLSIRITPGEVESKLQQIESVWKKIIPDDPMDFTFYDTMFDAMYRKEKLLAKIITIFSVIAIVLSCMGILGQVFQTCISRTKEMGIRKVNGASTWTIIRILNFNFAKLILVAFAIACPLSYYIMSKWLQNFAYKTGMSWWVFALSGLVMLVISFTTVTWQSWRAASRNPVEALRYE